MCATEVPQVSGTGEGKQMKPQLKCSDVERLPRGPPRQTGPPSGAAMPPGDLVRPEELSSCRRWICLPES